MPTTSEWTGQYGGPLEAGHEVVVDAKGWRALAAKLGLMDMEPDFAKSVAVAVFAGEKTTGGFTTAFDEPSLRGDDLLVRCRLKRPTGFTTQALTQPWAIKVFPRPKGKVVVELVSE